MDKCGAAGGRVGCWRNSCGGGIERVLFIAALMSVV